MNAIPGHDRPPLPEVREPATSSLLADHAPTLPCRARQGGGTPKRTAVIPPTTAVPPADPHVPPVGSAGTPNASPAAGLPQAVAGEATSPVPADGGEASTGTGTTKPRRNRKSAKTAGTRTETAIVEFLRTTGFPYAERRARNGAKDQGDISGLIGGVIEAKDCNRDTLAGWVREATTERDNAGAWWGAVWHKKRGTSYPGDWYVTMTGLDLVALLRAVYDIDEPGGGGLHV